MEQSYLLCSICIIKGIYKQSWDGRKHVGQCAKTQICATRQENQGSGGVSVSVSVTITWRHQETIIFVAPLLWQVIILA